MHIKSSSSVMFCIAYCFIHYPSLLTESFGISPFVRYRVHFQIVRSVVKVRTRPGKVSRFATSSYHVLLPSAAAKRQANIYSKHSAQPLALLYPPQNGFEFLIGRPATAFRAFRNVYSLLRRAQTSSFPLPHIQSSNRYIALRIEANLFALASHSRLVVFRSFVRSYAGGAAGRLAPHMGFLGIWLHLRSRIRQQGVRPRVAAGRLCLYGAPDDISP